VHFDPLIEARSGERDQRFPLTTYSGPVRDVILAEHPRGRVIGRGMHLEGRLRSQPHPRSTLDADDLAQAIAAEHTGSGRGQNHVQAVALRKTPADTKRRLGVRRAQNSPPVAVRKRQLQPGMAANH